MGILSSLQKGIKAIIEDYSTPESFKVGQQFEDYVRESIFTAKHFDLISRTHNYSTNSKDYVEDSLKPDFTLRDKNTKQEFYLEAKFRSGTFKEKYVWCNDKQLYRYKECAKEKPFFLILGIGESPNDLEAISLMPLEAAKYAGLFPSQVKKYEIPLDTAVLSKTLWTR